MTDKEYAEIIRGLKEKIYELRGRINELSDQLRKERDTREHCEYVIKSELEPRIKREEAAYDAWITTDHAAEAAETFSDKVDELIDMVKENPAYFDWDGSHGDIYEMVLYLLKAEANEELKEFRITDEFPA